MESPLNQDWLDEVARRRLPEADADRWRRELSARPAEARRLEEELALNALLDDLPRPSVPAGFTGRVLTALEQSPGRNSQGGESVVDPWRSRLSKFRAMLRPPGLVEALRWVARPATIGLAALVLSLTWGWDRVRTQRHGEMARTAAEWSGAAATPGVAALRDFEAIQLLETRSAPDDVVLMQVLRDEAP